MRTHSSGGRASRWFVVRRGEPGGQGEVRGLLRAQLGAPRLPALRDRRPDGVVVATPLVVVGRQQVVGDEVRAPGPAGDGRQEAGELVPRQVHRQAEGGDHEGLAGVGTGRPERLVERRHREVGRHVRHRAGQAGAGHGLALALLHVGQVHLEHGDAPAAVGEGVEPRADEDVLAHAGSGEQVLREPGADRGLHARRAQHRVRRVGAVVADRRVTVGAEEACGEGVREQVRCVVDDEVRGARRG